MAANPLRNPLSRHCLMGLLSLLFMISTLHTALAASSTSPSNNIHTYENYIKTACNSTTYPALCYKSLSPYAFKIKENPHHLCKTALSTTLKAARNASSTVKMLSRKIAGLARLEAAVIKDCIVNMENSLDELKQSLNAMKHLNDSNKEVQLENIKTWVSAALIDEHTCMDGFEEGGWVSAPVKNKIRNSLVKIAWLTSNALCLINNLKH
ncbi:pectinesterase inhibitor 4-like [Juglans microcarpa x Juglans regia]|uniref:pectinesterase inhibitor 4-like n=1 Tax=Juglans microcarpa x Juglans regia TaxID=2249226 RepID=UPI001B7E5A83|nr:pectinesterase inhibitor 4-like [Juglans microcarpa x Juglans regia]